MWFVDRADVGHVKLASTVNRRDIGEESDGNALC